MVLFIEHLTPFTWFVSIFPQLLRMQSRPARVERVFVIDASNFSLAVARLMARVIGVGSMERFAFRLVDVLDERGDLVEERLRFFDLFDVERDAMGPIESMAAFRALSEPSQIYLRKNAATLFRRKLLLINLVDWWRRQQKFDGRPALMAGTQPFMGALRTYSAARGIELVGVRPPWEVRRWISETFGQNGIVFLQLLRFFLEGAFPWRASAKVTASGLQLGVQSYGQLNLAEPERNSDLFFLGESGLAAADVTVAFGLPNDPLTPEKFETLKKSGFSSVAINPGALRSAALPYHLPAFFPSSVSSDRPLGVSPAERRWIGSQIATYGVTKKNWARFFERRGIRLYVSWFRFDAAHCIWTEAMADIGGISCLYQRAHQSLPSPLTMIATDVLFSFSKAGREIERASGSSVRYYVATGFLGEERFNLLRPIAMGVRDKLRLAGAKKIVAFYDENSGDDERWHTGHGLQRDSYRFVLEKILSDPELGLVIKPKVPKTLRRRLGAVDSLLREAESTGRCHIFESGHLSSAYMPAVAALAADIAIHNCLNAGSAGIEAALAGCPTVLMDQEHSSRNPLYELGERVAFKKWDELWRACEEFFAAGKDSRVGDWSAHLDAFDPFRDGRATERMGAYLKWLLDGLKSGKNRDAVLADAAERYASQWGADKISEIHAGKIRSFEPHARRTSALA